MIGYLFASASILLATIAQLLMKWGLMEPSFVAVGGGIVLYGLSMICWMAALRTLPLSRAYPLLGMSYALVYLAAVSLPCFGETLSLVRGASVLLIMGGIYLITARRDR